MSKTFFATIVAIGLSATAAAYQTGCIAGTVFDENGNPLSKMAVTAMNTAVRINPPSYYATTDKDGNFEIRDFPRANMKSALPTS